MDTYYYYRALSGELGEAAQISAIKYTVVRLVIAILALPFFCLCIWLTEIIFNALP